jgi:hypothetical protein
LGAVFEFKDLGAIKFLIGIRVRRDRAKRTLTLDQEHYAIKILHTFGMEESRSEITPEPTSKPHKSAEADPVPPSSTDPTAPTSDPSAAANDSTPNPIRVETYRTAIGALMYLANGTRPDIAHAVNFLARHQESPTDDDLKLLKRTLRYLRGTQSLGITYSAHACAGGFTLEAWSDADWGGRQDLYAHSTSGGLLKMAGAGVYWNSTKQDCIALSSSESEYIAASDLSREIRWARVFLAGIHFAQPEPTPFHIDNRVAINMAREEGNEGRRKHINIRYHFIREQVNEDMISLQWVETAAQQADILTKALPRDQFIHLRSLVMGIPSETN